jgi:hypothetical protein
VKRRSAVVAALALAAGLATGPALAATGAPDLPREGDTNGCVVVKPIYLAVCIPRL